MEPYIKFNDEVLVSSIPYFFSGPRKGDIVAFRYTHRIFIKRIRDVKNSQFLLEGDKTKDSLKIEWVKKSDIIGKVIYKL